MIDEFEGATGVSLPLMLLALHTMCEGRRCGDCGLCLDEAEGRCAVGCPAGWDWERLSRVAVERSGAVRPSRGAAQ